MLNVVDGCIPSDLVGTTAEIEEERRLLYVAMTRAKDAAISTRTPWLAPLAANLGSASGQVVGSAPPSHKLDVKEPGGERQRRCVNDHPLTVASRTVQALLALSGA
jgi:superfamily I DNA/RNA helicase